MSTKTTALPDWKKGRKVLYVWVAENLHDKIKKEAKLREIPMRRIVAEIMERAIRQL